MTSSKRRASVTSLCGAAVLLGACAGSTEPASRDEPAQVAPEPSARSTPEGGGRVSTSSVLVGDLEPAGNEGSSDTGPTECNYNDVWHCHGAHQGWFWVRLAESGEFGRERWCCVLVGPESRMQWGWRR